MMKEFLKPVGVLAAIAALGMGSVAHAQQVTTDPTTGAFALNAALDLVIGSSDNTREECPGGVPGGDEDIYDYGQDGIPDFAQMWLVYELYTQGKPQVVSAVNDAAAAFAELQSVLEGEGATPEEAAMITEGMALWAVVDLAENMPNIDCFVDGIVLTLIMNAFANVPQSSDLSGVVGANADANGDGTTNLQYWQAVSGAKTFVGDDPAFIGASMTFAALAAEPLPADSTPFPPAPQGTPVAGPLGIALLAAGAAGLGLYRMRRKQ